eukprot:SAG31_NODE_3505_length_4187_cov_2.714286_1_plen_86_part_00
MQPAAGRVLIKLSAASRACAAVRTAAGIALDLAARWQHGCNVQDRFVTSDGLDAQRAWFLARTLASRLLSDGAASAGQVPWLSSG